MNNQKFIAQIRDHIAKNQLDTALQLLSKLLENSPQLDEVIQQAGRYARIREQIRWGTVSHADATLTENQIRMGLIALLGEVEYRDVQPHLQEEIGRAISIVDSKNVIAGDIRAGGNVTIGDTIIYGKQEISRILTMPPFQADVFLGRDNDLAYIRQKLVTHTQPMLLVNGEGGIGKTTLAAKYWQRYQHKYKHLAWVFAQRSLADALLGLATPLHLQLQAQDLATRFGELLRAMANLQSPSLLVIDNANDLEDLRAYYQTLSRCGFHILLTSRVTQLGQVNPYPIKPISEADALAVFKRLYPRHQADEDELFKAIRHAVGGNTLVMELLAKNLAAINTDEVFYPLADLLQDLQKNGLLRLSQTEAVHIADKQTQALIHATPTDIIAALYDEVEMIQSPDTEAKYLLSNLAVLPAENIPYTQLKTLIAPDDAKSFSQNLTDLAKRGWIEKSSQATESFYKISPVVQSIIRQKQQDRLYEDCEVLIGSLIEKLEYSPDLTGHLINASYEEAALYTRYGENVVEQFKTLTYNLSWLCGNIGRYYQSTGDLNKALYFYEKQVGSDLEMHQANPENTNYKNSLAISYGQLGTTHILLDNLSEALNHFEKTKTLFEQLYEAYPSNVSFKNSLGISYEKLGDTHSSLGNLQKALELFELRSELGKQLYEAYPSNVSFKNNLAISYLHLGSLYRDKLKDTEKAKVYFQQGYSIYEELIRDFPAYVMFQNNYNWVKNTLEDL